MPNPASSDSSRGGRAAGPARAKGARRARPSPQVDRTSESPPWKRRAEARESDDAKGKKAGWGGVARKGAGRLRDDGPGGASLAFREAVTGARPSWEPERWIDEGEVRGEARQAVDRGRSAAGRRASAIEGREPQVSDPSLRRAIGAAKLERVEARLKEASRSFRRERFEEARRVLRPLAASAPTAVSVRELLGLTYYRLGKWKLAATELEAFRDLSGSTEQNPVLADCYRALRRHAKVVELWDELSTTSPSAALVAEGRIVLAGSLADQGRLGEAIGVLEASKVPAKRALDHHLRVAYALADLHERAGDVAKARQLFGVVEAHDPELGDVVARVRGLE